LAACFEPMLGPSERAVAGIEGWIFGLGA